MCKRMLSLFLPGGRTTIIITLYYVFKVKSIDVITENNIRGLIKFVRNNYSVFTFILCEHAISNDDGIFLSLKKVLDKMEKKWYSI